MVQTSSAKKFFGRGVETETTRIWNMPRAVIDSRIISMIYVKKFTEVFYVRLKKHFTRGWVLTFC